MKYIIKIPKPCNEDWRAMTPTEKGVFCANCQKEVLDFTHKSKFDLARLLDKNENLCGKFRPKQLNVEITSLENSSLSRYGTLLAASSLLAFSSPVFSQNKNHETIKTEQTNSSEITSNYNEKQNDSIQIRGQVLDEVGVLPGANVVLKGFSYGTQTDFDGNFSIAISQEIMDQNPILTVSYVGSESQDIRINRTTKFLKIEMENGDVTLGIVVIYKQSIFKRIGNFFRKKDKNICD